LALALTAGCGGSEAADDDGDTSPDGNAGAAGDPDGGVGGTSGEDAGATPTTFDVGFAPMGRLNRLQYNNTVHDLLGTTQNPANRFPTDELALGFDTISAVLGVQPEHIEAYLAAAHDLVTEFLARGADDLQRQRYVTCDLGTGQACQLEVLRNFASTAWRRPAVDAELAPYTALAATAATPDEGLALALRGVLTSSKFIFRMEIDPDIQNPAAHDLDGYQLASRLSYFLWSTMPDTALLDAAKTGTLLDDAGLTAQLDRMLAADRGLTLVDTFGAQWLNINRMQTVTPDPELFADFDAALRQGMIQEGKAFFTDFLSNDLPLPQLFTADFAYLNARTAEHYGVEGVTGDAVQRVSLEGTDRLGLLTQGAFLVANSNPTRTSPVKRGLYIMERLLCAPPPSPPPGVNTNIDQGSGLEDLSVRERLAEHQKKGDTCDSCHKVMDAIGLGLENYDAVGKYRTEDEYGEINATGELTVKGESVAFNGAKELGQILTNDPRITQCAVEKLLTFGLGRSFGAPDLELKKALAATTVKNGGGLRAAIKAIVMSNVFRARRAAAEAEVKLRSPTVDTGAGHFSAAPRC
jgi:hypothetical protein